MSLILEALRKSEAERRRGESPGLRAELPPAPARPRRAIPAWGWAAIAALALLLTLLALWPRHEASIQRQRPGAVPAADDTGVARADRALPPSVPQASTAGRDALPRVERIEPRAPEPVADSAPAIPTPAATAAATVAPPSVRPAVRPATPSPGADAPRLSELPPAQRKRMPEMRLSMHMWNADPARRFVIIDGHRQVEGDRVGDATITAIDADGVVLELDGRPVRLPLR